MRYSKWESDVLWRPHCSHHQASQRIFQVLSSFDCYARAGRPRPIGLYRRQAAQLATLVLEHWEITEAMVRLFLDEGTSRRRVKQVVRAIDRRIWPPE